MAKTDIWMPVFIGDFFKDTMHLESEDQGFYLIVLVHLWNNEGACTKEHLRRCLKLSRKKFEKKFAKISDFFVCFASEIFQKRLLIEFQKSTKNREIKAESGKRGGMAKPKTNQLVKQNTTSSPSPSTSPTIKKNIIHPIWDQLCVSFGLKPVTKNELSHLGKIVRDLNLKEAKPEQIPEKIGYYKKMYPDCACTPDALLKHWDLLRFIKPKRLLGDF